VAASIIYMRCEKNITDTASDWDGCAIHHLIAHPCRTNKAAVVSELQTAHQWINRVHRRKRLVVGHQVHLQQALTRDSEKPKIVSWCRHGAPFL
jgi:hypothetical protein